jgi:hypothetical protein
VGDGGGDEERAVAQAGHAVGEVQAGGEGDDAEVARLDGGITTADGEGGGEEGARFERLDVVQSDSPRASDDSVVWDGGDFNEEMPSWGRGKWLRSMRD